MKNHEIRSNKYHRIARWAFCLSILVLVGLFFSFGIPYPFLNKDIVHCPVGDEGEEFRLISTYRKYIHLGMFFKDVRTRSKSSDYTIYFKSPKLWRKTRVPGWLEDMSALYAPKRYCPYFAKERGVLYFSHPSWGELSISDDGGQHFEHRYPNHIKGGKGIRRIKNFKPPTTEAWFHDHRASIESPHIVYEVGIFLDKEPCTRNNYVYKSNFDKRLCTPITVYRVESNDLGRSWTDPTKVEQSELFK